MTLQTAELVDHLDAEGTLLIRSAAQVGWDAPVPYVGWTAGELVRHTGAIHRWSTEVIRSRATELDTSGELTDAGPGPDEQLTEWFVDGLSRLVSTLRTAPADLAVATLIRTDDPVRFWARRQAHETAIHRADVQSAARIPTEFGADFAQDGMGELLTFARARPFAIASAGTLGLVASDGPSWLLTFGGERNHADPSNDARNADATVTGTSAQLYLWLWNRDSGAATNGDRAVLSGWADTVRIQRG
jgi:uncharacterized protein (TIGR03083 family)